MIAILDYGAGNLTSVFLAFRHLGAEVKIARSREDARDCSRIVFPGVGSAGSGMAGFNSRGFPELLKNCLDEGRPVLAVCLGMQMLLDSSAEDGGVDGLGLFKGKVLPFQLPDSVKVPHMGWNQVQFHGNHRMFEGIRSGEAFYFVHSFYAAPENPEDTAGTTEYAGFTFTSAIAKGTLFATQFHPERSGEAGLKLLRNFMDWEG